MTKYADIKKVISEDNKKHVEDSIFALVKEYGLTISNCQEVFETVILALIENATL